MDNKNLVVYLMISKLIILVSVIIVWLLMGFGSLVSTDKIVVVIHSIWVIEMIVELIVFILYPKNQRHKFIPELIMLLIWIVIYVASYFFA